LASAKPLAQTKALVALILGTQNFSLRRNRSSLKIYIFLTCKIKAT